MLKWATLIFLIESQSLALDVNFNPRYDLISGNEILFSRGLMQTDISFQSRRFKFFMDGFGEADFAPEEQKIWRRSKNAFYLQELYGEFSGDMIYFKIGRQATRWSDSWVSPSLDIWTGRRYERLFIDPLSMQLAHSTGGLLSIVGSSWSVDLAAMWDVAQDTFPEPYPNPQEVAEKESVNPGLRAKLALGGIQSSFVAARTLRKNTFGMSVNYAFEKIVPKIEVGGTINEQKDATLKSRRMAFSTFGMDIFWDQWTLTPQFTGYSNEDLTSYDSSQFIGYMSATYSNGQHEFQWQNFSNKDYTSTFYSAAYTYALKQNWSFSALIQNYQGTGLNLSSLVEQQTGGTLVGVRVQYNGSLIGRK